MAIGLFRCLGMSVYCMLLERSVLTCPFLRSPSLLQAGEETWANRLQSDETVTETQTPVSSFSCCPFLWHWVLSSCTFMSKTMLTLSEHLCVWPCFFVGKLRAAGSVTRWRPSLLKWTLWLISASSCGRGWGRKKSKVRANSRLQLNSVRLTYLYRRLPPDPRPRLDFVRETRPGTSPGFKGGAWHPVPSHPLTKGCCPLLPRKHESHQVYYLFPLTVMDIFSVLLFTFPLQ